MIWLLLLTGCGLSLLSDLVDLSEIAENGGSGGNQSSGPDADDGLAMDCPEDVDVFTAQVWTPGLGQQCVGCPVAGGVAAGTQMVLDPDDMRASLRASAGVAERLVAKPTGQQADGHGGDAAGQPSGQHRLRCEEF